MPDKLFLLDGMALVYRAHFALMARPIFTSKGVNTSALFVFTNTLLDILQAGRPTHLAVAFDTEVPTARHREFPAYKIQREAMPEDLVWALPHVRRLLEGFRVPVLIQDGYEADDIIGTLVGRAESAGFESYMVTPDKDFAQLVTERTFIYKPGRMGDPPEVLGPAEVRAKWGVEHPRQVIDILGLWGDATDNIPGVPGIGEKTASKLILQYGSVENLLAHTAELKGRQRESIEQHREQALLSKRLATIDCQVPIEVDVNALKLHPADEEALKALMIEFEFNSIGRRLFGSEFKAGRGSAPPPGRPSRVGPSAASGTPRQGASADPPAPAAPPPREDLKTLNDTPHDYRIASTPGQRAELIARLGSSPVVALAVASHGVDPKQSRITGLGFSTAPHTGWYVPLGNSVEEARGILGEFRAVLEDGEIEKAGHDLKSVLGRLRWQGVRVGGRLFDVMLAHSLMEPDLRHSLEFLSEVFLGYTPMAGAAARNQTELALDDAAPGRDAGAAMETADLSLQLRAALMPGLKDKAQERVFYDIEAPLVPALVDMEHEGVRIDTAVLVEFGELLRNEMSGLERNLHRLAGMEFNVNSPRQLGEVLFEKLKLSEAPKKTRTGQYATDEQTLLSLAAEHEIVRLLLDYREASKLKSTYADALPAAVFTGTGRVHTTFQQLSTATGRLNSHDPNLQNIPIRSRLGQKIREAFVARDSNHVLLSADYSQIELRIIAALSRETAMIEALKSGADIHVATASRVFGVPESGVTPEMRERCKMVNYGIAYGMSAFGLAQRLRIPRREAAEIIEHYFAQFPGIRGYMTETIETARRQGYVETVTGRRRYLRDIGSSNATVRGAAERNAINTPIQGSAADMIKLAMVAIQGEIASRGLKSRMILQVHDELLFDVFLPEQEEVASLVEDRMKHALPLEVPIVVEIGTGRTWLEAH